MSEIKYCTECGARINKDVYCTQCGKKVVEFNLLNKKKQNTKNKAMSILLVILMLIMAILIGGMVGIKIGVIG